MSGVLDEFHCDTLSYEFQFVSESFNLKKFCRATGIGSGERWTSVLRSKNQRNGYHVHFDGRITAKTIEVTVAYWDGSTRADTDEIEPFAESIMQWLGAFTKEPSMRVLTLARFKKPPESWRPRFNLPFKVTMGVAEVTIDGVSVELPHNRYRALNGWLSRTESEIIASVQSVRTVEFSTFEISAEVAFFNEAIKMLVEPQP